MNNQSEFNWVEYRIATSAEVGFKYQPKFLILEKHNFINEFSDEACGINFDPFCIPLALLFFDRWHVQPELLTRSKDSNTNHKPKWSNFIHMYEYMRGVIEYEIQLMRTYLVDS